MEDEEEMDEYKHEMWVCEQMMSFAPDLYQWGLRNAGLKELMKTLHGVCSKCRKYIKHSKHPNMQTCKRPHRHHHRTGTTELSDQSLFDLLKFVDSITSTLDDKQREVVCTKHAAATMKRMRANAPRAKAEASKHARRVSNHHITTQFTTDASPTPRGSELSPALGEVLALGGGPASPINKRHPSHHSRGSIMALSNPSMVSSA